MMKRKIILIIINALLVAAFSVCLAVSGSVRGALRSQQAAEAWAGRSGRRFAQLSVFLPGGSAFGENSIYALREAMDRALADAVVEPSEGGSLYADAWSAPGEVSIVAGRNSATVRVYGVGGDFFLFHPLYLRDGSYISGRDLAKDRVVLDEELAWRLFGSFKIAGFEVLIGGKPYIVAGVVSREDDFASSKAYTDGAGLFMSIEALRELSGGAGPGAGPEGAGLAGGGPGGGAEILCYELVLADPVAGFALKTLEENFPASGAVIVENSSRYSLPNLFGLICAFGERSMRTDEVSFPYWENAARYSEDRLALLLALTIAAAIFPAACAIFYGAKGARYLIIRAIRSVSAKLKERDAQAAEEYRKAHGNN